MTLAKLFSKALNTIFQLRNRETGATLYNELYARMKRVTSSNERVHSKSADSVCRIIRFTDGSVMRVLLDYGREKAMVMTKGD